MSNSEQPKRNVTSKQIVAIIGVILLVLLYLVTLLAAIFGSPNGSLFWICLVSTIIVPIIVWIYAWIWKRLKGDENPDSFDEEQH